MLFYKYLKLLIPLKYMEYLNKLEEKELIRYDYFEVALLETQNTF